MSAHTFEIRIQPHSDALYRIISICHRRGVQIAALSYATDELTLTIDSQHRRLGHVERWLTALVDVRDVCAIDPEAEAAGGCARSPTSHGRRGTSRQLAEVTPTTTADGRAPGAWSPAQARPPAA